MSTEPAADYVRPVTAAFPIAPSRKRVGGFELHRPTSLDSLCRLWEQTAVTSVIHAGGIDLVSRMKRGERIASMIAIDRIPELSAIVVTADLIRIGAAVRHREIETNRLLLEALPEFCGYVAGLGNIRIRMQGTIGGNLMAGQPAYEMSALLAVLDARLTFLEPGSCQRRILPVREWLTQGDRFNRQKLLMWIEIPRRARRLIWTRDFRPNLTFVMGAEFSGSQLRGISAIAGSATETPVADFMLGASEDELAAVTASWRVGLPEIVTPFGPSVGYWKQVLPTVFQRLLHRILP